MKKKLFLLKFSPWIAALICGLVRPFQIPNVLQEPFGVAVLLICPLILGVGVMWLAEKWKLESAISAGMLTTTGTYLGVGFMVRNLCMKCNDEIGMFYGAALIMIVILNPIVFYGFRRLIRRQLANHRT